jgi:hypothetical protein
VQEERICGRKGDFTKVASSMQASRKCYVKECGSRRNGKCEKRDKNKNGVLV